MTSSEPAERRIHTGWLLRSTQCLLAVLGGVAIAFYVFIALKRMRYPYELEWLESGVLEHTRRILDGEALYTSPSVDFVQFAYPPGYGIVTSLVGTVSGANFFTLRLVSFVASVGVMFLIGRLVRKETGKSWAAVVGAGLFAASYRYNAAWFDVGKADSLFLLLTLASIDRCRSAETRRASLVAGLLMAAAVLTKQTALFVGLPVGVYLLFTRRSIGAVYLATSVGAVVIVSAVMQLATHGWFTYFVWEQLLQHERIDGPLYAFVTEDLRTFLPVLALLILAAPMLVRVEHRWQAGLYVSMSLGLLAGAWSSRIHEGGYDNVLMPVCVVAAVILGLAVGWLVDSRRSLIVAVAVVAISCVQFNALRYDIGDQLPTASDERAGKQFVGWLRMLPDDVLVMSHPTYAVLAGKASHAQWGGTADVLRATDLSAKADLRASYAAAIHERRYSAIVLDNPGEAAVFPDDWQNDYYRAPDFHYETGDGFLPVTSPSGRPTQVWLRR